MHINPREEHDIQGDDGFCGSCCSTRVSSLVEDMESGANSFHCFGALFFWDVRLGQDHGEMNLTSLELGVISCFKKDMIIIFLMFMEILVLVLIQELKT
jgi:hypothetical protein